MDQTVFLLLGFTIITRGTVRNLRTCVTLGRVVGRTRTLRVIVRVSTHFNIRGLVWGSFTHVSRQHVTSVITRKGYLCRVGIGPGRTSCVTHGTQGGLRVRHTTNGVIIVVGQGGLDFVHVTIVVEGVGCFFSVTRGDKTPGTYTVDVFVSTRRNKVNASVKVLGTIFPITWGFLLSFRTRLVVFWSQVERGVAFLLLVV